MSQANRLKLKKSRRDQVKQKYKHGEIQKSGSKKRGYKVRYWNQKTGSWQSTKPSPLINKVNIYNPVKPLTRAEKLKKEGMATWDTKKENQAVDSPKWDEKGNKKVVNKEEKKEVKKEEKKNVQVDNKENKVVEDNKVVEEKKEVKGKETLKIKKLIKKKKGKGFVSTKSPRGKQLLKIEERKRKLREKRFGKK